MGSAMLLVTIQDLGGRGTKGGDEGLFGGVRGQDSDGGKGTAVGKARVISSSKGSPGASTKGGNGEAGESRLISSL